MGTGDTKAQHRRAGGRSRRDAANGRAVSPPLAVVKMGNVLSTWRNVLTLSPDTVILGFLTSLPSAEEGSTPRVRVEDYDQR